MFDSKNIRARNSSMKITGVRIYQMDLPLKEGRYSWGNGKYVEVFDSTLVAVETDAGIEGYGEACPLGPVYLPAYATGVRAGVAEISRHLIGLNPTNLTLVNHTMDNALSGHPYVKSPIDIACWDILGKSLDAPLCDLLGGRQGEAVALYRAISQLPADEMAENVGAYRESGYRKFQLKTGGEAMADIARIQSVRSVLHEDEILVADANRGWQTHDAMRVVNAVADQDVYIEQPCHSYKDCLSIRRSTTLPFILDESIHDLVAFLRASQDRAMDAVNLKISKLGGLSKTRLVRDLCVELDMPMTIEDSWGGDITTATIAHLAHSTPERCRFSSTDFNDYVTIANADGAPQRSAGTMVASKRPGLGIVPNWNAWGKPVSICGKNSP